MIEVKIKADEVKQLLNISSPQFPKYATQILNIANRNAQATRPKVVGQMSELIQKFTGKTLQEWENWYLERYPEAIDEATRKIVEMIENFKDTIEKIDEEMIRQWVRDLVIVKTFIGLRFQEAVFKKIAQHFGLSYRLADPEEESKGIDGFIGNIPVSLKPITYQHQEFLQENIQIDIVFYEKQKNDLKIIISDALEDKLKKLHS